jgi:multiple sugar transport system substrate-binding protein
MAEEMGRTRHLGRREFLRVGAGLAVLGGAARAAAAPATVAQAAPATAPAVVGAAKPFAGVTLNAAMFEHTFSTVLKELLPDFEQKSGIKVNLELQAFPIYNQRADLELSTKGSAYDVLNVTFIYAGRWVGAGWFTNLEELVRDPNRTPPDWLPDDFVGGAIAPFRDRKGDRFGFPWLGEVQVATIARPDLIQKAGLRIPETYEDLMKVLAAVHEKDGVRAYVAQKLHHWLWIHFLHGFGGNVFKDPPENLTPTLASPAAIQAAEFYANILRTYAPEGVLSYTDDQMVLAQVQGRANISMHTLSWTMPVADPAKSKVADRVVYAMVPAGPKGLFPGTGSHALGIPVGSKKKEAAWEFVKWAVGKDTIWRQVKERSFTSPCRLSILNHPDFKGRMTKNGVDLVALATRVFDLSERGGYMKYRTVPVFPQVGDKINKAIEAVTTRQLSAEAAMKQAQAQAIADLKRAGVKVDG